MTPRDPLREALYAEVGRKLTDARVEELMRAEAIPLHGRGVSVDLQARGVAAAVRVAAMTAIDAALASSTPDAAPRFREDDERWWATPGLPDMAVDIWRSAILRRRRAR